MNPKREALIEILGGHTCKDCGISDHRVLEIDHVFGNGKEMPLSKTGILQYYIENPDIAYEELQVLCANCHKIKSLENGDRRRKPEMKQWL